METKLYPLTLFQLGLDWFPFLVSESLGIRLEDLWVSVGCRPRLNSLNILQSIFTSWNEPSLRRTPNPRRCMLGCCSSARQFIAVPIAPELTISKGSEG
jgi:hypothetical protein